jgi:lysophospholipase L1-like esterase
MTIRCSPDLIHKTEARSRRVAVLLIAFALVAIIGWSAGVSAGTSPAPAQQAASGPARFEADIEAFRAWDRKNTFPADAVLFVGSSSIRLWQTAAAFPDLPVINRGFGGSTIPDVNHYIEDLVLKYRPAVVVFYAGDNDISGGGSPEQVFGDYRTFVDRVLAARADTRLVFVAIKPSLSRWSLWPLMREVNDRVRAHGEDAEPGPDGQPRLFYADVATPMLGSNGEPRSELFVNDGLHLSEAGYELWNSVVGPVIDRARAGR